MIESEEGSPSLMASDNEIAFLGFGQAVDTSDFSAGMFTELEQNFQQVKKHSIQCTVGEDERIPVIRYDFQAPEWEAIARLLVKGFRHLLFFR